MLWEFSIFSSLSWYCILVQHACNDRAWLTSECSPRHDNFDTVRQAIAWYIEVYLTIFNQFSCFLCLCKIIKKCYTISSPWTSSLARIAFNTPAIFFLEFSILGMMYTQLARDVTWWESLLLSLTKLCCRLIYMLFMLYVRLTIKVKVGIPESFKVGWYPDKITGSSHLSRRLKNIAMIPKVA